MGLEMDSRFAGMTIEVKSNADLGGAWPRRGNTSIRPRGLIDIWLRPERKWCLLRTGAQRA
ncbi:hypothetical protein BF95_11450 [Sphingobium sp. Ant17]|nr:hypothetical protein BF95_11450 [Sphingobium sp. Ant17]